MISLGGKEVAMIHQMARFHLVCRSNRFLFILYLAFAYFRTNLVTALTSLKMNYFTHCRFIVVLAVENKLKVKETSICNY